jgi:hypothetical protein
MLDKGQVLYITLESLEQWDKLPLIAWSSGLQCLVVD